MIKQKFKIEDEVYYGGIPKIFIVSADKENPNSNPGTTLPTDMDYLITLKESGYGFTAVKESDIRKNK